MTKANAIIGGVFMALSTSVFALPPKAVVDDLGYFKVKRGFKAVRALPNSLQLALAKTFHQAKLWMASRKN